MNGLQARVETRVGGFELRSEVAAAAGEVVAVLGPNGAGKSSLLRALAGLLPLTGGTVSLGGRVLEDPSSGVRLRPEERRVGVVFQDDRLFPHLSVTGNVGFGPRAQGLPRWQEVAAQWVNEMGLDDLADRRAVDLSGGEARRVSLARALAAAPDLLLLDEPLAAADLEATSELRRLLRTHIRHTDYLVILVTHDPVDAATLADRIAIMEDGTITQTGNLRQVTEKPRSDWAARLGGLNLFRGRAEGNEVHLEGGGVLIAAKHAAGPVWVTVHPRAVALFTDRPAGSPRNTWQGRVRALESDAGLARVSIDASPAVVAEVTAAAVSELRLLEGDPIWVSVKATELDVYPM